MFVAPSQVLLYLWNKQQKSPPSFIIQTSMRKESVVRGIYRLKLIKEEEMLPQPSYRNAKTTSASSDQIQHSRQITLLYSTLQGDLVLQAGS